MKNIRGFALGLGLGLAVALSTIGLAQDTKPANQKAESCCAMESCCKGGSCSMKDHAKMDHSKEHAKSVAAHEGCCCCGGDSCSMKMKEKESKEKAN